MTEELDIFAQQDRDSVAKALEEAREFCALITELAQQREAYMRQWESRYRYPYPRTIEDWQRLAVLAGLDATIVFQGQWKPADVLPVIEGYLLRRNELVASDKPSAVDPRAEWEEKIVKATRLFVGGKAKAGVSRLVEIAESDAKVETKLRRMEQTGLLRSDASARELADLLEVSPTAVKKTRWWRNRMVVRRQAKVDPASSISPTSWVDLNMVNRLLDEASYIDGEECVFRKGKGI